MHSSPGYHFQSCIGTAESGNYAYIPTIRTMSKAKNHARDYHGRYFWLMYFSKPDQSTQPLSLWVPYLRGLVTLSHGKAYRNTHYQKCYIGARVDIASLLMLISLCGRENASPIVSPDMIPSRFPMVFLIIPSLMHKTNSQEPASSSSLGAPLKSQSASTWNLLSWLHRNPSN